MLQKASVNRVFFKGNSPVLLKQENSQDNKPREFDSNFYVDKKGASAIRAKYFVASKYPAERKPISFDEYMEGLKRVPGQDYDVTLKGENGSKGAIIAIYYKRGDVEISKNHHVLEITLSAMPNSTASAPMNQLSRSHNFSISSMDLPILSDRILYRSF